MSIVCLWSPSWRIEEESFADVAPLLLREAPRLLLEGRRGIIWADGLGLPAERLAATLLELLEQRGISDVHAGVAAAPIAAEAAARSGQKSLTSLAPAVEAAFLATSPLTLLTEDDRLLALLEGSGVRSSGELAQLSADAVEVRFGSQGVAAWRLARGDDRRILFRPIPPDRPQASLDFLDYTVRDATRLVFTLNALLDQVCSDLQRRARRARSISLTFFLSGGGRVEEVLRTARPTADRTLWMRRLRAALERITLPDAISGVALEVPSTEPVSALQGDLFDLGFATASFVEEAVARLLDVYRGLFVRPAASRHPLAERRTRWVELLPEEAAQNPSGEAVPAEPSLHLQLLDDPRPIRVRARTRRDHVLPVRYLEGKEWRDLVAAGPDRISGGHEEHRPYAREYFRCVCTAGSLLWIYRDAVEGKWYLHGWWE